MALFIIAMVQLAQPQCYCGISDLRTTKHIHIRSPCLLNETWSIQQLQLLTAKLLAVALSVDVLIAQTLYKQYTTVALTDLPLNE